MITDPALYFQDGCGRCGRFGTDACSARLWAPGLAGLRGLCRGAGLVETAKWGHPVYTHAGRNVAILGALQGGFRLAFFEAGLLDDPGGLLEPAGPNTPVPGTIRFTDPAQVTARAPAIKALLAQARDHAAVGRRAPRVTADLTWPDEWLEALASDPDLSAAFDALTPGRQRSYAFALADAKQPATRVARIARWRDRILEGKGALDR